MAPRSLSALPYMLAGMAAKDLYRGGKKAISRYSTRKKPVRGGKSGNQQQAVVQRVLTSVKRHQETNNVTSRKLHALYDDLITAIPQGDAINQRERQQIFVRGVKLAMYCQVSPTTDLPSTNMCTLRVVLAQYRYVDSNYTVGGADANDDLFKGMLADSVTGFTVHSNGLNSLTLPINSRKWKVFFDRKYSLKADSGYNATMPNVRTIEEYIPVNQKVVFEGTGSTENNNPLVLLWWYETPNWSAAGESTTTPVQDRTICNVYYNDIL